MSDVMSRVAGAPITWGVDGSPGWGYLMDRDRVMAEMVDIGLSATELGPDGYLPLDPDDLAAYLSPYGLRIVAAFVPGVLYRQERIEAELAYVDRASRQLAGVGADVMVLGPASHLEGYDTSIEMSDAEWDAFLENLGRLQELVAGNGLATALHPHWGMAIERQHHVERLLASSDVELCIDTGHLAVAGADSVKVTEMAAGRVRHVHLKDVDAAKAAQVRSGEVGFRQAVINGMFKPLGTGDVDIAGVIRQLEASGYDGWYVLEQDASLSADPPPGGGPVTEAAESVRFLEDLAKTL